MPFIKNTYKYGQNTWKLFSGIEQEAAQTVNCKGKKIQKLNKSWDDWEKACMTGKTSLTLSGMIPEGNSFYRNGQNWNKYLFSPLNFIKGNWWLKAKQKY